MKLQQRSRPQVQQRIRTKTHSSSRRTSFSYSLYGVTLRSEWELPFTTGAPDGSPVVELSKGTPEVSEEAAREATALDANPTARHSYYEDWFRYTLLSDRRSYLRWPGLYQFLISQDGRCIRGLAGRKDISQDSFHTYLLGMALSVALIRLGVDPLHATVVQVGDAAFGLLGKSGYGKSTLAAAFLQAGYRIVTDDLLVPKENAEGYSVYPGPPRIKLMPEVATHLIRKHPRGTRMNPATRKLIIPLRHRQATQELVPLKRLYVLNWPRPGVATEGPVRMRKLSPRKAVPALLEHSFNDLIHESDRLVPQFLQYSQIASLVPVKRLSYPRRLDALAEVREAILADLKD